jgi:NAD-dependent SIR2 family protein deacetylase
MQWDNFLRDVNDSRRRIWQFALQVLTTRSQPRGPTHTFANFLARHQFIKGIVTTNVDGLEVMQDSLLATNVEAYQVLFSSPPAPWIGALDNRVAYIHGDICTVACSSCWQRTPLTLELARRLIDGTEGPCEQCSRARASRRALWRPDIFFYQDPREELQGEHQDGTYAIKPSKKRKKHSTTSSVGASPNPQQVSNLGRYHSMMATDEASSAPARIFVIGSSLLNPQLSQDLISCSRRGAEVILVNPQLPAVAKSLKIVTWIQSRAEDFSQLMLETMAR